jgi:hypothetical protein
MVKWKSEQMGKDKSIRPVEGVLPFFPFRYFAILLFHAFSLKEEEGYANL